ncbi:MAG: phage tail protein [Nitrososphaerales archaeon]
MTSNTSYVGICNKDVATKIAFRDLRNLTIPLAKVTFKVNRQAVTLRPGDVFKLIWEEYGLPETILRATKVAYAELDKGMMEIESIEDVFSLSTPLYTAPPDTGWENPVGGANAPTLFEVLEQPYVFSGDSSKIEVFCARPDTSQLAFNTYTSPNNPTGTYTQVDSGDAFTPTALLDSDYPLITLDVSTTDMLVTASTPDQLVFLKNFSPSYIESSENLFWIANGTVKELCAFEEVQPDTPSVGKYTLTNIWRGLGDTVPVAHAAGSRLWFFTYGEGVPSQSYNSGDTIYSKVQAMAGTSSSGLSTSDSVSIVKRSAKPYPPGKFQINGSTSTVNISTGTDIVVAWEQRNRVTQGEDLVKQFTTGILHEQGTEYYIKFYNATNTLLRTVGPLTTTTYTYTNANQVSDNAAVEPLVVTVQLYSKRDGLFSFVPQQRTLLRPTGVAPSPPAYSPGGDVFVPPTPGSASYLNGVPVCTNIPTNAQALVYNSTDACWKPTTLLDTSMIGIEFVIDGGGSAITTGVKGDLEIPFNCTINRWTLVANQSGSIVVDVWKDSFANAPPTVADSITASAKPTVSSAEKAQSSTLTGWTTTITADDVLRYNVDSITDIQRVTLSLRAVRT